MLIISDEQMEKIEEQQLEKYTNAKKEKYKNTITLTEPDLFQAKIFRKWIKEANSYGIKTSRELDLFIELHLEYEAIRERPFHPEFRYTLTLKHMNPSEKVSVLLRKNKNNILNIQK